MVLGLVLAASPAKADRAAVVVAVPKVVGGGGAGPKIEKALVRIFRARGLEVVSGRDFASRGSRGTSGVSAAKRAGADFLVSVKVGGRLGRLRAEGRVIRVADGRVLKRSSAGFTRPEYRPAVKALAGDMLEVLLDAAMLDTGGATFAGSDDPASWMAKPPPGPAASAAPRSGPIAPSESNGTLTSESNSRSESESEATKAEALRDVDTPQAQRRKRSHPVVSVSAGAGTRVLTRYALVAQGRSTGHDFGLGPLLMGEAGVDVRIPETGVELSFRISTAAMQFAINVEPRVTPSDPSGRFLDVGATGRYLFSLGRVGRSGSIELGPAVTVSRHAMSVETQDRPVVVGYGGWSAGGGAALALSAPRAWRLDVEGLGGVVLGFGESPVTSGSDGRGLRLDFGVRGTYWFNDHLGGFASLRYGYQRVALTGPGTRQAFEAFAPVQDAALASSDLQVGIGVTAGF